MWDSTLRKLHAIRQALMCGLGNNYLREAVWEKQYWKAADEQADQKLYFEDVERLCRRLNINPSHEDLDRRFKVRPFVFSFAMANSQRSKPTYRSGDSWTLMTSSASLSY
jgi:hypothetical protein